MLQTGMSQVQAPNEITEFFNLLNLSSCTMALGLLHSFHMCYAWFGAYPNHINITILVKTAC
jgi:hypothetical protein